MATTTIEMLWKTEIWASSSLSIQSRSCFIWLPYFWTIQRLCYMDADLYAMKRSGTWYMWLDVWLERFFEAASGRL
jgi:hypothetical protein